MQIKKSFTLIELVMVMVLMGIIALMALPMFLTATKAWHFQVRRNELAESGRVSLLRMVREIRDIRNATSVTAASGSSLSFINTDNQAVSFGLSGSDLGRTVDGTTNVLTDNVNSLSFTYYDSSDAVIASPTVSPSATDIKRVKIDIVSSFGDESLSFTSGVSPRRLQ